MQPKKLSLMEWIIGTGKCLVVLSFPVMAWELFIVAIRIKAGL